MATRSFKVTLYPAYSEPGSVGITTRFELCGKSYPSPVIDAVNPNDLLVKIAALADFHGEGCSAYVRPLDNGRKWAGFDAKTKRLFFNTDVKPAGWRE